MTPVVKACASTGIAIALMCFTIIAVGGNEGQEQDSEQVQLVLDLAGGSRLIGTASVASIKIITSYAKMDVPLALIREIRFNDDRETAFVELAAGDKIKGVIGIKELKLATLLGEITIDVSQIIHVSAARIGRPLKGLVLWNRLDSEFDVAQSSAGPGGKLNAGRFVEGRFGKGVALNMNEQCGVTFPAEIAAGPDGCVEFWAKLVDFPDNLEWGARPGLVGIDDGKATEHFMLLNLNGNDGQSNGGLCAGMPGLSDAGTGQFGQWTYARAMGCDTAAGWHHYAIVWASAGIPGVENGKRTVAAYVDGKLNSTFWHGSGGNTRRPMPATARLFLLYHNRMGQGTVIYDNIRVWNHARTDFSDRDEETPRGMALVPPGRATPRAGSAESQ